MFANEAERRDALTATAARMVKQSGDSTSFDGVAWLNLWLQQPVPALGGKCPADYLETDEGLEVLIQLLQRSRDGVYG